jgi:hypothetical protein
VLVMREVNERPEVIELRVARQVGVETGSSVGAVRKLLTDAQTYGNRAARLTVTVKRPSAWCSASAISRPAQQRLPGGTRGPRCGPAVDRLSPLP